MRRWIPLTLALAVASGSAASLARAAAPSDMVRGGSFEEAAEKPGIGRDWASESYGGATIQFALDADKARAGKQCQHIRVEGHKEGGAQIRQLGFSLTKGKQYEITLWMRGNLAVPVKIGFRKAQHPYTYYLRDAVKVTPTWQKFTITGIAPEDDTNAGLYIFFAGNGDLWIDNISAKPIDPPPATTR